MLLSGVVLDCSIELAAAQRVFLTRRWCFGSPSAKRRPCQFSAGAVGNPRPSVVTVLPLRKRGSLFQPILFMTCPSIAIMGKGALMTGHVSSKSIMYTAAHLRSNMWLQASTVHLLQMANLGYGCITLFHDKTWPLARSIRMLAGVCFNSGRISRFEFITNILERLSASLD